MAHNTRSHGSAPFELTIAKRTSSSSSSSTTASQKSGSSSFPLTIELPSEPTVSDVKKAINAKSKSLTTERQRLTTEDKRALTDDSKTLQQESIKTGDTLWVKDLGPQVAWKTVFLTEYVRADCVAERKTIADKFLRCRPDRFSFIL